MRDRGLKLLRSLHDGPHYKRIVIVAHSLGTMLAHDLLSYFWAEREAARTIREGTLEFDALCALEQAAAQVALSPDDQADGVCPRAARVAPSALRPPGTGGQSTRSTLADQRSGDPGESLTHAEFLIAADRADLERRLAARELPKSPPYRERLDPNVLHHAQATHAMPIANPPDQTRLMSYPVVNTNDIWMLHHAAPFAAVRWTNIYDPAMLVFFGDVISGPLRRLFGPAIVDINLKERRGNRRSMTFTHTKYWALDEASRIRACREAVNLLDRP